MSNADEVVLDEPVIVDEDYERELAAKNAVRRALDPFREEAREAQRDAKAAYDIANPPHVQDAKAADALMAQAANMRASGRFSEEMIAAIEHDAHVMRTRNLPRDPTLGPVPFSARLPFTHGMLEAEEHGEEVEAVIAVGPVKVVGQKLREAQKAAQAENAKREAEPRVRVSEFIDEHEEEIMAELERGKVAT